MLDTWTNKVILAKPVRRKTFILGKSVALESTTAAVMDDGTLRVITQRRADYFEGKPLTTSWKPGQWKGRESFPELVEWLRHMEADYTTAELSESA
ncbi:hypothetical protein ACFWOT_09060 [Streptomyces sp. NPDC058440]|uniref:hypothetical protein n=1 Tax=Streptomyces sp. NPDC058440 TaxID=3346501 RepID=UPI00365FE263